jgi:hypothetical protein
MKLNALFLTIFIVATTLFTACKKDEATPPCTPPALAKNIIGTWNAKAIVLGQTESGKVTFNADGTVVDTDDFLINASIGGQALTDKTWTVSADEKELKIKASKTGVGSMTETYDIKSQTCSSIEAVYFGIANVTFSR